MCSLDIQIRLRATHECVDNGADVVVTAHSHCLGGMEVYKGKTIW